MGTATTPVPEGGRDPSSCPAGLDATAERLDRLMTLEIRPFAGGLPAGIVVPTYLAARKAQGAPLSGLAAMRLAGALRGGGTVLVVTGAGVAPNLPHGETDGPPGAAVLAAALSEGFGARTVLVSQAEHLPAVRASGEAASHGRCARIEAVEFPKGDAEGRAAAEALLAEHAPAVVVFVERDGPNEAGHYHGVRGDRRPPGTVAGLHVLAELARAAGIPTVGVGDGGNEIGFGLIRPEISGLLPNGGRSQPDETGVVTVTATDVLVSASVSNWGCYAIVGALSILACRNLLHDAAGERRLIEACVAAGARDGANGQPRPAVDGIDAGHHGSVIELMRAIVDMALPPAAASGTWTFTDAVPSGSGVLGELTRAKALGGACP